MSLTNVFPPFPSLSFNSFYPLTDIFLFNLHKGTFKLAQILNLRLVCATGCKTNLNCVVIQTNYGNTRADWPNESCNYYSGFWPAFQIIKLWMFLCLLSKPYFVPQNLIQHPKSNFNFIKCIFIRYSYPRFPIRLRLWLSKTVCQ